MTPQKPIYYLQLLIENKKVLLLVNSRRTCNSVKSASLSNCYALLVLNTMANRNRKIMKGIIFLLIVSVNLITPYIDLLNYQDTCQKTITLALIACHNKQI